MKWVILFLGIMSNAAASVMIKLAMQPPRRFPSFSAPMAAIANWPFWLGLGLYGAAFLLYAAALARFPLNVAHPILTTGSLAAVAACSLVIFKEPMHWQTAAGIALVATGVLLIALRAS